MTRTLNPKQVIIALIVLVIVIVGITVVIIKHDKPSTPTGSAIEITTRSLPPAQPGSPYVQGLQVEGGDGGPYQWILYSGGLPSGLNLSPTGTISGTSTSPGTVAHFVVKTFESSNPKFVGTRALTLTTDLKLYPQYFPDALSTQHYVLDLSAVGGQAPYHWTVAEGHLPSGLSLSPSGVVSGKALPGPGSAFTIQARDSSHPPIYGSQVYSIGGAMHIVQPALHRAKVGAPYLAKLTVVGGRAPYHWRLRSGRLPPGVSLSESGVLAGIVSSSGNFSFTVEVTDSSNPKLLREASFVISTFLVVSPSRLPRGSVGVAYSVTLQASEGTPPYGWTILKGSLPPGMSLSPEGVISGSPSISGIYGLTVLAKDSSNPALSITQTYALVIPLKIFGTLPKATVDMPYSATLTTRGGTAPYQWEIFSGTLPPGLTLSSSGVISGTVTSPGTSTFAIRVADSSSPADTGYRTYTLTTSPS